MANKAPSFSSVASAFSSPCKQRRGSQLCFSGKTFLQLHYDFQTRRNVKVNFNRFMGCILKLNKPPAGQNVIFATSEDEAQLSNSESNSLKPEDNHNSTAEPLSAVSSSLVHFQSTNGKPGLVSFYNRPYKTEDKLTKSNVLKKQSSLLWLTGPAVLVASFIFPSLYLRRIFSDRNHERKQKFQQ